MTEKILAKHADRARVAPGENIWTNVDKLLTHDVCGPGTFGIFQKEFGENAQVRAQQQTGLRADEFAFTSRSAGSLYAWPRPTVTLRSL